MKTHTLPNVLALALATALAAPGIARAETRACTPVTSLPATLDIAGVYCLTQDLATAASTGTAITIAGSDIVLDCNGYKLGGLGAGPASQATGIATDDELDGVVVRNCSVRGFRVGIALAGTAVRVEDNRLDGNLSEGIRVEGQAFSVTGNRVFDTGNGGDATGIVMLGSGAALGNFVTGVDSAANGGAGTAAGMTVGGSGPLVLEQNRVRGIVAAPEMAAATALAVTGTPVLSLRTNWLVGSTSNDTGIGCAATTTVAHSGNTIAGFTTPVSGCGPDLP